MAKKEEELNMFAGPNSEKLKELLAAYEQCKKAFFQNPSPRLGNCLKSLEASIKYERKSK